MALQRSIAGGCTAERVKFESKGYPMRAMILPRFGGPDLFELRDVERPKPAPGELLVRVIASAVNPVDAKLRANGSWANLKPPVILGYDVAGVVEEAGPGVLDFTGAMRFITPRRSSRTHTVATPSTMWFPHPS